MQTQADVLGLRVSRPGNVETTAMGAALASGVGAGLWTEDDVFSSSSSSSSILSSSSCKPNEDERGAGAAEFEPAVGAEEREARYLRWCDAVRRSLDLAPTA